MLTRKLAVPLVNEKILAQAVHCYIATARITDGGFDFLKSRIPPKCRVDVVIGAAELTSPRVLRRILNNYSDTISLKIHTRGALNANVYIFELPFRKSVAFVGSGMLSLEGLKDQEELFWKLTTPKEIESLFSWFTSFFEFGTPLSDLIIDEYDLLYPNAIRRDFSLKDVFKEAILRSNIAWDSLKWKNQFFKLEHYRALAQFSTGDKSPASTQDVWEQLLSLQRRLAPKVAAMKLFPVNTDNTETSNVLETRSVWIAFSRKESGFNPGFAYLQLGVTSISFAVRIFFHGGQEYSLERKRMGEVVPDEKTLDAFSKLHRYILRVAHMEKPLEDFQARVLQEMLANDPDHLFPIAIEKQIAPGDSSLNMDRIEDAIVQEFVILKQLLQILAAES